jgi:hypothetical protein
MLEATCNRHYEAHLYGSLILARDAATVFSVVCTSNRLFMPNAKNRIAMPPCTTLFQAAPTMKVQLSAPIASNWLVLQNKTLPSANR